MNAQGGIPEVLRKQGNTIIILTEAQEQREKVNGNKGTCNPTENRRTIATSKMSYIFVNT